MCAWKAPAKWTDVISAWDSKAVMTGEFSLLLNLEKEKEMEWSTPAVQLVEVKDYW